MLSKAASRWVVSGVTFVLWVLAAASAVAWGLQLASGSASPRPLAAAAVRPPVPSDPALMARLLGASPAQAAPAPALASRFALSGVVAQRSRRGLALISVDGKPARPFRVGAAVDPGLMLIAVEPRKAMLGPDRKGQPSVTLELPVKAVGR